MVSTSLANAAEIERLNPPTLLDTSGYGFNQVVVAPANSKMVFLSGQFSGDLKGQVQGKTVVEQAAIAFENLRLGIEASGAKPEHVLKIQVLVVDHDESKVQAIHEQITKLFGEHLPASTLIPVPRLALDAMLFEIDATLAIPQ